MERRYALLDGMGVRDISNYNIKIKEQNICTEKLPPFCPLSEIEITDKNISK